MFSFVGDTILDPFWGIGNTTIAAMNCHRSSIGFEIEKSFYDFGMKRIMESTPKDSTVTFEGAE